jgi:hypothetical protein
MYQIAPLVQRGKLFKYLYPRAHEIYSLDKTLPLLTLNMHIVSIFRVDLKISNFKCTTK